MIYINKARAQIELARLQTTSFVPDGNMELASEIANALMDGCAEELVGCNVSLMDADTRERVECVLAAIKGTGIPR